MVITGFEKKGKRVLVHFDNGTGILLNYEIFMKNGLRINNDLSESRFSLLQEDNIKHEIKLTAFNLLSRRIPSSSELKTKLRQKHHNSPYIDEIVEYLIENKYLDDKKFAAQFIEEKGESKLWGNRKISSELKRRGINYELADEEFITEHLENNSGHLMAAAQKKLKNLTGRKIPDKMIRQKLIAFLLGKGFNYDDISAVVEKLVKDTTEEQ